MQSEPFGEHKALRWASLARWSSVGIVGHIMVVVPVAVVVVGSRSRRRGLETPEHRVLSPERGGGILAGRERTPQHSQVLMVRAGVVEKVISFDRGAIVINRSLPLHYPFWTHS